MREDGCTEDGGVEGRKQSEKVGRSDFSPCLMYLVNLSLEFPDVQP